MPLYALMAATGSTLGCVLLYFIARKGGEAFFHSKAGRHGGAVRHWIDKNGFGGMLAAAFLPPPTPFKIFVFAAGVFEMPLVSFASAIAMARLCRYLGVGYLAVRYGDGALPFLQQHKLNVALGAIALVAVSYGLSQLILRAKHPYGDAAHKKTAD
jgi:membrane protein YqaA with SNARE-associated domain